MTSEFKCTFWTSYSDWTIHPVKHKRCEESTDTMNRGFIVTQKYSTVERHMEISEHWNPKNFLPSGWK